MSERHAAARPRPVADAPVAALTAVSAELAKRWLIALIAGAELADAARLPVGELAADAPALIDALVRSLSSDAELARLTDGGDAAALAARAGGIGGARDPGEAVRAIEALRVVVWEALLDELRGAGVAQVADLAARLGYTASEIAAAAAVAAQAGSASVETGERSGTATERSGAVEPESGLPAPVIPFAPPPIPGPRAPIGDVPDEGPAAWIGSIGRRLERFAEDSVPFAVLLIEIADIDRLRHSVEPDELDELVTRVERALSGELRPADVLTREGPGRYWLVTPETDPDGARLLAERLARAVHGGEGHRGAQAEHRGAPLQVAIGIATCPDDGQEAAALAARADVGVYAARAAGRPTAGPGE